MKARMTMKNNNRTGESGSIPIASRFEMVLFAALGALNIVLVAILSVIIDIPAVFIAGAGLLLYLSELALVAFKKRPSVRMKPLKIVQDFLSEGGSKVFKSSSKPVLAFDSKDVIVWYNDAFAERALGENYIGKNLEELFGNDFLEDIKEDKILEFSGRSYGTEVFSISDEAPGLYILLLDDKTELVTLERKYYDERAVVAYIAIDNIEDILQFVHDSVTDAVSSVEAKLKAWAESLGAMIRAYDNDKFVMLFDNAHLDALIKDKFSILDEVRDARVGDSVSITVSMGIAAVGGTLAEREAVAKAAIDTALQRGGDQVVFKTENETVYYGGKTKSVYKRSNVRTRTFSNKLTALFARKDNVIIMGHRYGDFDSFGASVGVARLAMLCGAKTNIAVDMRDRNLSPCIEMMQKTDTYAQVFVDNAEGLDLVGPDTLLVLVDHNAKSRAQFEDIAKKVSSVAIIDHHRRIESKEDPTVELSFIEPSASSASELVTEMLENAISSRSLLKEEADMLLAGIILDTKQLTRNTGTRTFGAAQYLRGAGADPSDVYSMFKTSASDLSKESRFHTNITIYRGNIAISACDGDTDASYRVIASKAADKMLSLKGIDAAFSLVRIGEQIHISGRSNGTINVQLILEKLHGGGHFDVAGAQVESGSVIRVLEVLRESIDEYFEKQNA